MEDLLSEVKSQCDELSGYMEASRQALINDFMNILSYIVIPASLILAIFSSNFLELQNVSLKSNWVSFAFIAAFILAFVVWQVLKRKEKKD
jgi:Mg2+ and Co2+ transporter CorA